MMSCNDLIAELIDMGSSLYKKTKPPAADGPQVA